MGRTELFHVGIVVPDLEEARAHFTDLLDLDWGPIVEVNNEVRDAEGNDSVVPRLRMSYSLTGPYIEVIEEQPGTPWVCNEHSNLHHIGFFSDDLLGNSAYLNSARCPLEISGRDGEAARAVFTYHRDPLGVRIEHIDWQILPMMEENMLAGGRRLETSGIRTSRL